MERFKNHLSAIFVFGILLIVIGFVVFSVISIRESKNHCIPKNGIVNDMQSFILGEIGFRGLRCQLGGIKPYTSKQYGFTINFLGTPTVTNSSAQIQGVSIPITKYEVSNNNGNLDYAVEVYAYPSIFDLSNIKSNLRGVLDNEVSTFTKNDNGSSLKSSNYGTLDGYTTINAHLAENTNGQTFGIYITNLLKGNTLFKIVTIGASESGFNNFANSFKFYN